ncbi:PD-(D/E)XK nuclease family protein [Bacillus sp. JJ1503]|uniref:PD-(D/E)XK nuclease family protein n=1 Tax=unclassified Bacillus (in: firmicutes) TaxID=185979 RepID=UPI002FFDAC74
MEREMKSIFEQLLSLYERSEIHTNVPLEDFTTEVFAGVVGSNQAIIDGFVNNVLHIPGVNFQVVTQNFYPLADEINCRVDMVFYSESRICFLENKVDTTEHTGQLKRYEKVLSQLKDQGKYSEIYLRYCTKNIEDVNQQFYIDFKTLRWKDIYQYLLSYNEDSLVHAFLLFLERTKLVKDGQLNHTDLLVMTHMQQTLQKLGELMEPVSLEFHKRFGDATVKPGNQGVKEIADFNRFILYRKKAFGTGNSEIMAGFTFEENGGPALFVQLWGNRNNSKYEEFQKHIVEREAAFDRVIETDSGLRARNSIPLEDVINQSNPEKWMQRWFCEQLDQVEDFLLETSNLDWNVRISRKVVAQQDEKTLLLQLGSGRGQILDLHSQIVNPAMNIDAILKFGYWEDCLNEYDCEELLKGVKQIANKYD